MAKPKLEIMHKFANGMPIAGRCSICGENIDENQPPNKPHTIEAAFELHVKQRHTREDVSQAAARIVREATK
jgi:hypothetical protein